jgi:hypothetical protein
MRRAIVRWMTGSLGMALVFVIASSTPVRGDYSPSSPPSSLLGEASAFVADFGQWNTIHQDLPMQFLQTTAAADREEAVLVLFWLWLRDSASLSDSSAFRSALLSSTPPSNLPQPNDPIGSTVGSIGMGTSGNGSQSSLSNGGGDDKTGSSSSSGSTLAVNDLPAHNGDSDDGQQSRGNKSSSGSTSHHSGSTKPLIDPVVPEPAGFMLFSAGGIGMLMGWWMCVRRPSKVELTQLAQVR